MKSEFFKFGEQDVNLYRVDKLMYIRTTPTLLDGRQERIAFFDDSTCIVSYMSDVSFAVLLRTLDNSTCAFVEAYVDGLPMTLNRSHIKSLCTVEDGAVIKFTNNVDELKIEDKNACSSLVYQLLHPFCPSA